MGTTAAVCSLENYLVLPDHTMDDRIASAREALGRDCVVLGHHYQRDEVIRFADFRGDSYKLAQLAAAAAGKYIVVAAAIIADFPASEEERDRPLRPSDWATVAAASIVLLLVLGKPWPATR